MSLTASLPKRTDASPLIPLWPYPGFRKPYGEMTAEERAFVESINRLAGSNVVTDACFWGKDWDNEWHMLGQHVTRGYGAIRHAVPAGDDPYSEDLAAKFARFFRGESP